ncbi:MAG: GspE/PulE family protein [Vulcanimicrobiota bacterium]
MNGKELISQIPLDFLRKHHILPLESDGIIRMGIRGPESLEALEDIRMMLQKNVEPVFITVEEIDEGLRSMMGERINENPEEDRLIIDEDESQDLLSVSKDAPIVSLVNSIFLKAVNTRASDIHIEPYEKEAKVRMRIDGILHEVLKLSRTRYSSVNARIKVMSKLNLAESRLPQGGRIRLKAGDKTIDVRVSTLPTLFGERIVMRLLDVSSTMLSMEEIGLLPRDYDQLLKLTKFPYGLLLATGPTGAGKSTTLYAVLQKVQSPERNIITIEDPVEYQVQGIGQIQVNPKIGLTFANGLRSIVRQDPDVVMVGEIRDGETAEIAINASLTGHLVLSTLHTNDAPTGVTRLNDMGVEGYLLSSSLIGVVAQRLVRRLCGNCKQAHKPEARELRQLGLDPAKYTDSVFYEPVGCEKCLNTGFYGRTGIYEVLVINEDLRSLITRSGETSKIRDMAIKTGMKTLQQDGVEKVLKGITSSGEILRATRV